jgi:hypothetical protein
MNQQKYRELLGIIRSAQRELNDKHDPLWDRVTLLTHSGEVIPVDEDTDETITAMEINTPADGYSSLWVVDNRGRCAAFPEVGIGSDVSDVASSVLAYGLPVVCDTPEELARRVILGE